MYRCWTTKVFFWKHVTHSTVQCGIGCRLTTVSFELCPLMEYPPFWQKHKHLIELHSNAKSFPQGGRTRVIAFFLQRLWFFLSARWGDGRSASVSLETLTRFPLWCSSLVRAKCVEAHVVVWNVAPVPLCLIRQSLVVSQNRSGYSPPTMFHSPC